MAVAFALPGFEHLLQPVPPVERGHVVLRHFPNGELHAELDRSVTDRDCVLVGSLAPPAEQVQGLLLAADTLKRQGARRVRAILPYLGYMRQDRLEPGRSRAAAWVGAMLAASGVDEVVTVDVHSAEALELIELPITSLSPAPLFARVLDGDVRKDAVVVAPDRGAIGRAGDLAQALGSDAPVAWLEKERSRGGVSHRRVVGELAEAAIVVDDILDTGGTLVSCCHRLRAHGVQEITIVVTHGLFTGEAWRQLLRLVRTLHTTDSLPDAAAHASEVVQVHSLAPLLEHQIAGAGVRPAAAGTRSA